ncbi:putative oxidoreductase [Lachnellula arida]|uniref:Putative oxidoreductase n=1 Tax=Lachnellula arida TaxID=1316785 RepID=A0A8T9BH40_9HELO|nr:putative oxidoreductase [Lachnellula arida]
MSPPIWLITGCSSGFGKSLALLALRSGHKVIATSRNPSKTPDLVSQVEKLGGVWHALDVCSPEPELAKAIEKATNVWGRIDILVNAAGYALLGAFETISDKEARAQMETNFFGPLTLTRLVLPAMRARHSGTIVQISSTAGLEAKPSRSLYSASKFGLEAFSEALYHEVKPLGIRVLIVEPGWFGTNFSQALVRPEVALPGEYEGTPVQSVLDATIAGAGAKAPNDTEKGCRAVFDVVMGSGLAEGVEGVLRLPLGKDCVARIRVKIEEHENMLKVTEKLWSSTDVDGSGN